MKIKTSIVVALGLAGLILGGCESAGRAVDPAAKVDGMTKTDSGLYFQIEKPGQGSIALAGARVTVNYIGMYADGKVFDTSIGHDPFVFMLGQRQVIPGWDEGLVGMRVGERRKLVIPPKLGYGVAGSGPIPPNSTLVFEVELLAVGR